MQDKAQAIALQILQKNIHLPPFPPVGSQLLAFNHQPVDKIDIGEFIKLIETDAGLVARILQLANSVYFGAVQKISNLRRAVMQVGLEESINAVSLHFFQLALPQFPQLEGFSGKDYWAHSWACASANRMLGRPDLSVSCLPGELYIAGLLHGVGKLILALHRPDEFLLCLQTSRDYNQPLSEAEIDQFGTTDSSIAYEILKFWQFPENICMAVKHYQSPGKAPPRHREIAEITQFAYYIANTSGVGNNGDFFCFDLKETTLGKKTTSPLSDDTIRKRVAEEIFATLQKKHKAMSEKQTEKRFEKVRKPSSFKAAGALPNKKKNPSAKKKGWLSRLFRLFR